MLHYSSIAALTSVRPFKLKWSQCLQLCVPIKYFPITTITTHLLTVALLSGRLMTIECKVMYGDRHPLVAIPANANVGRTALIDGLSCAVNHTHSNQPTVENPFDMVRCHDNKNLVPLSVKYPRHCSAYLGQTDRSHKSKYCLSCLCVKFDRRAQTSSGSQEFQQAPIWRKSTVAKFDCRWQRIWWCRCVRYGREEVACVVTDTCCCAKLIGVLCLLITWSDIECPADSVWKWILLWYEHGNKVNSACRTITKHTHTHTNRTFNIDRCKSSATWQYRQVNNTRVRHNRQDPIMSCWSVTCTVTTVH